MERVETRRTYADRRGNKTTVVVTGTYNSRWSWVEIVDSLDAKARSVAERRLASLNLDLVDSSESVL